MHPIEGQAGPSDGAYIVGIRSRFTMACLLPVGAMSFHMQLQFKTNFMDFHLSPICLLFTQIALTRSTARYCWIPSIHWFAQVFEEIQEDEEGAIDTETHPVKEGGCLNSYGCQEGWKC